MAQRIGIDTGGTFTDFVLVDEETGELRTAKVPSTPSAPKRAVEEGLRRLADGGALDADRLVVGSTVATNAVIQRRGPRLVFVTNEGFTDVPFIGRMDKASLYDLHWQKPRPLVHRCDAVGIGGRIAADGSELEPLDEDAVRRLIAGLGETAGGDGDLAVGICMLFSYLEPGHERAVASAIREALPDVPVSVSHEVSPLWREHERASTTLADAFVKPVVGRYISAVGEVVEEATGARRWNLLASNGGYLRADEARRRPVALMLSGLAGGVIGAAFHARAAGRASAFTLDMGGTSCDIGLVIEGEQQYAAEFEVAFGQPVSLPCVSVETIGAGGGSIAWIDPGGLLRVGPQSAGAEPGPAAYGRGGREPTVTDANLVLGRLDPASFLGGEMELHVDAAEQAVAAVGRSLELGPIEAALAVTRIADENMANAIRLVAVERGIDPRDFALIAFGGAGPLHARSVAERLGVSTLLIPPGPGLCSAFGAAIAQARVDRLRTLSVRSTDVDHERLRSAARALEDEAVAELRRSVDAAEPVLHRVAAMRYLGQNYDLEVELPPGEPEAGAWEDLLERFGAAHAEHYGFELPGEPVELISLRVTAAVAEPLPAPAPRAGESAEERRRVVQFEEGEALETPLVDRAALAEGAELTGPAVILEPDSTTLVWRGDRLRVLSGGVMELTVGGVR
jgi:N-methylhydantoinase A